MLKKLSSLCLAVVMLLSLGMTAFAEYFFIEGFEDNNLSAKMLAVYDNYIFVAGGATVEDYDVIDVYDIGTKQKVTTLGLPVYTTGKNYWVEGMYAVGDKMYISWNRNRSSGDPSVRSYDINDMIKGKLTQKSRIDVQGNCISSLYDGKLFFTSPKQGTVSYINTDSNSRKIIMNIGAEKETAAIKEICADKNFLYLCEKNRILAYSAKNLNEGAFQNYDETLATYESEYDIKEAVLHNGNLYVANDEGMVVLSMTETGFEEKGKYTHGGRIMAISPQESGFYVYASLNGAIQKLDVTNPAQIGVLEEITVNDTQTAGIGDILVHKNRVYAADLTEGLTLYSQSELDNLEQNTTQAESFEEELKISSDRKAIELVVGLGIMKLRSNGLFGSELYITRGEFADSVSKLLGDIVNGKSAVKKFSDVPETHEYAEGIYGLANLGYLNGFGDGTFKPDEPIAFEHAVKIMLRVLGYYPLVESAQRDTLDLATELKILDGVTPNENGYISRENTARLIYNSLETATLKFAAGIDPYLYQKSQEETLLYKMDIRKVKGQVKATEFTSLSGAYTAGKGKVKIDNTEYFEGQSGASLYLGRYITAYYECKDDTIGDILYIVEDKNESIIKVAADKVSDETTKTVFAYFDENDKVQKTSIQKSAIIYNGKFCYDYTKEDLMPDDGEIVLIDADSDGQTDTVIVDNYKTYVVQGYSAGVFKLKYGYSDINLNKLSSKSKIHIVVDGVIYNEISAIKDIKENNILSVKASKDGEVTEIYVTKEAAVGVVSEIVKGKTMDVEDIEYKISPSYLKNAAIASNNIKEVNIGDEVFAYLNKFGQIADFKFVETSYVYGYLITCQRGEGLDIDKAQFKILARDLNSPYGAIQRIESSENFKINGVKVTDIYAVNEFFKQGGGFKPQIIKYRLDREGKIKELYTAIDKVSKQIDGVDNPNYEENYKGYDENAFTYDMYISKSMAYRGNSRDSFEGEPYIPTADTIVFKVPADHEGAKDEDYKIYNYSGIFRNEDYVPAPVYCYDHTADYTISACVVQLNTAIGEVKKSSSLAIVDSFVLGVDEDGEKQWILRSAKDAEGNYTEYPIENEDVSDITGEILNNKYLGTKLIDLPKGSVIQYVTNAKEEIAEIRVMHIPTDTPAYYEANPIGSTISSGIDSKTMSGTYAAYAKAVRYVSLNNRIVWNAGGMKGVTSFEDAVRTWDRSATCIAPYLYDSKTGKLSKITASGIFPDDDIFICIISRSTKIIVVYR